jgi:hypothetical protein
VTPAQLADDLEMCLDRTDFIPWSSEDSVRAAQGLLRRLTPEGIAQSLADAPGLGRGYDEPKHWRAEADAVIAYLTQSEQEK